MAEAILIAALSGRALAQAARASGYRPLVADMFRDLDTREAAEASVAVPGDFTEGFEGPLLMGALSWLEEKAQPAGLVYGAGFEREPALIDELAEDRLVFGNRGAAVARAKDPETFAALCAKLGIAHPPVSMTPPAEKQRWLRKMRGASGGNHIRAAADGPAADCYFQEHVDGLPVSALFLAAGGKARVLGWSRQWCAPSKQEPWRYGGAAQPCGVPETRLARMEADVLAMSAELDLKGLNGADFIAGPRDHWLLEINPRPGAALDVFQAPELFAMHIAACRGSLSAADIEFGRPRAAAVAYSASGVASVPDIGWPAWTMDRQPPETSVPEGGPLCTVFATAESAEDAIAQVQARIHTIRTMLEKRS